jgi:hypothetical protein
MKAPQLLHRTALFLKGGEKNSPKILRGLVEWLKWKTSRASNTPFKNSACIRLALFTLINSGTHYGSKIMSFWEDVGARQNF